MTYTNDLNDCRAELNESITNSDRIKTISDEKKAQYKSNEESILQKMGISNAK